MKLQRKLTNREWAEIVALGPGVRNYRGKRTLFYNGEKLYDEDTYELLIYDKEERESWEVIIVLPGVEVIPDWTFYYCENVKMVIMADTVKRIEKYAFWSCYSLVFVKLSRNLEFIGQGAFYHCRSLTSIFIPPSCAEIKERAFYGCKCLLILGMPQNTMIGEDAIADTALLKASHFEEDELQLYLSGNYENTQEVNAWIKNLNDDEEFALHRTCSSYNPLTDIIYEIVKRQGLESFKKENQIGVTPLQYLEENPFADIDQRTIAKRYVLDLMGETI